MLLASQEQPWTLLCDYLKKSEWEITWTDGSDRCFICAGETPGPVCRTPAGAACVSCTESALQAGLGDQDLGSWTLAQFKEALSPAGRLHRRLLALWRFDEVAGRLSKHPAAQLKSLMTHLVKNLGYAESHPLDEAVRQAAYQVCKNIGEPILMYLLQGCETEPWQFYANVLMAAGRVAPENMFVRDLLERAGRDSRPEIRRRVLSTIASNDSPWARALQKSMIKDAQPEIRRQAAKIIAQSKKRSVPIAPPVEKKHDFKTVSNIDDANFIFADNGRIITQLKSFCTYFRQGKVRQSKSTALPLDSSIRQMALNCAIKEFYDEKPLDSLRTKMIVWFLESVQLEDFDDPALQLKRLVTTFITSWATKSFVDRQLLSHLRWLSQESKDHRLRRKVMPALLQMMCDLPLGQWVAIEDLISYARDGSLFLDLIPPDGKAYISKGIANQPGQRVYEKCLVSETNYHDLVLAPFLKGVGFLLAGLGILDLAYDLPENRLVQQRDKDYLSVFDGLKYLRLTDLGEYVFGVSEQYQVIQSAEDVPAVLAEDKLVITWAGNDQTLEDMLTRIGHRVTGHEYKVDQNSFLRSCSSSEDVVQLVANFQRRLAARPPLIWQQFLDSLINKIDAVEAKSSMLVFQIKADEELPVLMANDQILKKYVLTAENNHVIISADDLPKVETRLQKFGYFINRTGLSGCITP
ncbi:MAG: HEAT repeat domain-containing protein [Deltaproteobacteria bacterium]|nr:HEAT repeat domain-containing protein [Deltaproteobacteria bacterium]